MSVHNENERLLSEIIRDLVDGEIESIDLSYPVRPELYGFADIVDINPADVDGVTTVCVDGWYYDEDDFLSNVLLVTARGQFLLYSEGPCVWNVENGPWNAGWELKTLTLDEARAWMGEVLPSAEMRAPLYCVEVCRYEERYVFTANPDDCHVTNTESTVVYLGIHHNEAHSAFVQAIGDNKFAWKLLDDEPSIGGVNHTTVSLDALDRNEFEALDGWGNLPDNVAEAAEACGAIFADYLAKSHGARPRNGRPYRTIREALSNTVKT